MLRVLALLAALLPAQLVEADSPPRPSEPPSDHTPGRKAKPVATPTVPERTAEPASSPLGAQRLDLTPARLFGTGELDIESDRRGKEKRSGYPLGNDSDWRGQAIQIGAMAAGFAALVGLCGGGKCMLPSPSFLPTSPQGPPPDLQIRENYREPRPAR